MKRLAKLTKVSILTAMVAVVMVMLPSYNPCEGTDSLNYTALRPVPGDCSSFFSCQNGVAILMHCPPGLYFNAELDVCDWPRNVVCIDLSSCYKKVTTNKRGHYVLKCIDGTTPTHLGPCPEKTTQGYGNDPAHCYDFSK